MLEYITMPGSRSRGPLGTEFAGPHHTPDIFSFFERPHAFDRQLVPTHAMAAALDSVADGDGASIEWSEEDIVLLHWRLLKEVDRLADPETPLEEKFDTLRWVFTERENDGKPFSFVWCLRVVGCSPLSPVPYCGLVDTEAIRDHIRAASRTWLRETLLRYPAWVRDAVVSNPRWVESRLARNPQWINEEVKRIATEGDLFA